MTPNSTTRRGLMWTAAIMAAVVSIGEFAAAQPRLRPAPEPRARSTIYVPKPKDDTLDGSNKRPGKSGADKVLTVQGDRIGGEVIDIKAGELRLTGPQFGAEARILVSSLDRIVLSGASADAGGADQIVLTNGDRISAQIRQITAEAVLAEAAAIGQLKIPRSFVASVAFAGGKIVLLDSSFETGRMTPFTGVRGSWSVADEHLVTNTMGNHASVSAKLEQNQALTMVARVEATGGQYLNCDLILFVDDVRSSYGRNSVFLMFQNSYYYLQYARNGGTNSIANRHIGRSVRSAELRLAYDPETSKATVWLDSTKLGEHVVPLKLKSGRFVMFNSRYPCKVKYIRVLPGIVPPADSGAAKPRTDAHSIKFANKDTVSATSVSLSDGELVLSAAYGQLRCPVEKIRSIAFATKGQQKPRRQTQDVTVQTTGSRFTVRFEKLTDQYLLGQSEHLGQIKVLRSALKQIRFNIYR